MSSEETPAANGSASQPPPGLEKSAAFAPFTKPATDSRPPDSPDFLAKVEAAVIEFLSKKPGNTEQLPKLGIFLRGRNLAPQEGLKRFITTRPDKFTYFQDGNGTNKASLLPSAISPAAVISTSAPAPSAAIPGNPNLGLPPGIDEKVLERQLVAFIHENATPENPMNMPSLGEYCIKNLGFSMKGYLHRFLLTRQHYFYLPDDGRQHVKLQPGAAEAIGVTGALPRLPDDLLGSAGTSTGSAGGNKKNRDKETAIHFQNTAGGGGGGSGYVVVNPHTLQRPADFAKWDRLTQEMFDYVASKGGSAPFKDVDDYIKSNYSHLVEAMGVPLAAWQSQRHSWKRRNIFRKEGHLVALHGVPVTYTENAEASEYAPVTSGAAGEEAFPPLGSKPSLNLTKQVGNSGNSGGTATSGGGAGLSSANPPRILTVPVAAASSAQAFAEQRKAMEALRDEVQANLNSLKALSELQKENAGLRAACVTLGRELLAVKDEVAVIKSQLAARGILSTMSSSPTAAGISGSGVSLSSDSIFLTSIGTAQIGTAGVPGTATTLPSTTVALIGGHDSVSWLESVETYVPSSDTWGALPSMPGPRSFCSAATGPDGSLYVAGGGNGVDWYDSAVALPAGGATWQPLATMRVARGSMAAAFGQGYLYAFGGGKPGEQYSIVEWYDPESNRWLAGPELGSRRFALAGAALGGALYAVGGYDGHSYLSTVERLDPREGRWAPVGSMNGQRGGHACTVAGTTQLYALGGYFKSAVQNCEVYDSRANTWRSIAPLADSRAYGGAAAAGVTDGSDVYVVGGLRSDMQTHAPLLERYSPVTDTWHQVELPAHVNPRRSFLATCTMGI